MLKLEKPPLTYYGGKQQLSKKIISMIPVHRVYDEPFFGGGAIYFAKEPVKFEFINDTNGELINFYQVLKKDFDSLKGEVDCTLHSEMQHKQAIAIYRNPAEHSTIKRAWAIWVLSHQSIYSILCNTWKNSKERNCAQLLNNKKEAFSESYKQRLENTSIYCHDALDVITKTDGQDTFHYIDPPYYQADMGHYKGYSRDDFEKLLQILSFIKGKFMLSSYPSELLDKYISANKWSKIEIDMQRSAGGGRKTEVITINYDLPHIELKEAQAA